MITGILIGIGCFIGGVVFGCVALYYSLIQAVMFPW